MVAPASKIQIPYAALELEGIPPELVDHFLVFLILGDDRVRSHDAVPGDTPPPPVSGPPGAPVFPVVHANALGRGDTQAAAGRVGRRPEAAGPRAAADVIVILVVVVRFRFEVDLKIGRGGLLVAVIEFVVVAVSVLVVARLVVIAFNEHQDLADSLLDLEFAVVVDQLPKEILLAGGGLFLDGK